MKQSTVDVKKSPVPDLREKSSGGQRPQLSSTVQIPKPVAEIPKSAKPVQKKQIPAAAAVAARPVTEQVNAPAAPKQSQEKVGEFYAIFLQFTYYSDELLHVVCCSSLLVVDMLPVTLFSV